MASLGHSRWLVLLAFSAYVACSSSKSSQPPASGTGASGGASGSGAGASGSAGIGGSAGVSGSGGGSPGGAAGNGAAGNGAAGNGNAGVAGTAGQGGSGGASGAGTSGNAGAAGAGTSGSSGTGGTAAMLTLTIPASCTGIYKMDFGATHLEVDPTQGARVSALSVGGVAVLANATVTGDTTDWGSTFWPSPQSWSWPPSSSIAALDPMPYTCASDAASFTFTSAANTGSGPKLQVTKKFYADLAKEAVLIDYTMKNTGTAAAMVAPWEISRVAGGALSFYPANSAPVKSASFPLPTTTQDASGINWYQHSTSDATQYKLLADGKGGWLASAVGGNVLVKQFADVPANQQAAGEAEVELYSAQKYVEVEQQGPLQNLAAGASYTWTVRWYVRPIPSGVTVAVGSASLVSFAQSLVQ